MNRHDRKSLMNTDMITTIPLPIIENVNKGHLIVKKLPFDLAPGPTSMSWHARNQHDPERLWLREKMLAVLNSRLSADLHSIPFQ